MGLWIGFIIGMIHQISAYLYLIQYSDWHRARDQAHERQRIDIENSFSDLDNSYSYLSQLQDDMNHDQIQ